MGLAALAVAARAAEMSLQRGPLQRDSSQVDLFVHGAPAGAPLVLFVYPGLPGAAGGEPVHTFTGRADALGRAHFAVAGIPLSDDLWTVRAVARPVLRHRVIVSFRGVAERRTSDEILGAVLESVSELSTASAPA